MGERERERVKIDRVVLKSKPTLNRVGFDLCFTSFGVMTDFRTVIVWRLIGPKFGAMQTNSQ